MLRTILDARTYMLGIGSETPDGNGQPNYCSQKPMLPPSAKR
jgi:hypothetical protein